MGVLYCTRPRMRDIGNVCTPKAQRKASGYAPCLRCALSVEAGRVQYILVVPQYSSLSNTIELSGHASENPAA